MLNKKLITAILISLIGIQNIIFGLPNTIFLKAVLKSKDGGYLNGEKNVRILIQSPEKKELLWEELHKIKFIDGILKVELGKINPIDINILKDDNVCMTFDISGQQGSLPFAAVPYSFISKHAISVESVDWSQIQNVPPAKKLQEIDGILKQEQVPSSFITSEMIVTINANKIVGNANVDDLEIEDIVLSAGFLKQSLIKDKNGMLSLSLTNESLNNDTSAAVELNADKGKIKGFFKAIKDSIGQRIVAFGSSLDNDVELLRGNQVYLSLKYDDGTKKVVVSNGVTLSGNGKELNNLNANNITSGEISPDLITDKSIKNEMIAPGIDGAKIVGTIDAKISYNSIENIHIKADTKIDFNKLAISKSDIASLGFAENPLTEVEVDGFVENNGYLKEIPDLSINTSKIQDNSVTSQKISALEWEKLSSIPQEIVDGDNDTQLSQSQVGLYASNEGFIKEDSINYEALLANGDIGVNTNQLVSAADARLYNRRMPTLSGEINGDMMYFKDGEWVRLPSGASKQILTVSNGYPDWSDQIVDTDTWKANSVSSEGFVAKGEGHSSEIWKTDATGSPNWGKIANEDIGFDAAISFSKLNITKSNITSLGIPERQLNETEVDAFVQNNGYLKNITNDTIPDNASIEFSKLAITKSDIINLGIPGNKLTETEVDAYVNNNGYLTVVSNKNIESNAEIDFTKLNISKADIVSLGIPAENTDTHLAEEEVDSFVENNGYLKEISNEDVKELANISFSKLAISKEDIVNLGIPAKDTNTHLTQSQVSSYAHAEGYIKEEGVTFEALADNSDIGSAANQLVAGNDSRLTNKRNPTVSDEQNGDMMFFKNGNWERLPNGVNGQVLSLSAGYPAWLDQVIDTNTWKVNSVYTEGYVAKGEGHSNELWKTDATGAPSWGKITNDDIEPSAGIAFSKLDIAKSDITSLGIPERQLNEIEVDTMVANNGYLTSILDDNIEPNAGIAFSKLNITKQDIVMLGIPDRKINEAEVDAYIANNGYALNANNLSNLTNATTARANLGLGSMATEDKNDYVLTDGYNKPNWDSAFVWGNHADESYLKEVPDNSISALKIQNSAVTDDKITSLSWSKITSIPTDIADGDNDTHLSQAQVGEFAKAEGYLKAYTSLNEAASDVSLVLKNQSINNETGAGMFLLADNGNIAGKMHLFKNSLGSDSLALGTQTDHDFNLIRNNNVFLSLTNDEDIKLLKAGDNIVLVSDRLGIGTTSNSFDPEDPPKTSRAMFSYSGGGLSQTMNGDGVVIKNVANSNSPAELILAKGKNMDEGLVSAGDEIGAIHFAEGDSNEYLSGAVIKAVVNGTAANNVVPMDLVFHTTATNTASSASRERMRINKNGLVGIGTPTPVSTLHVKDSDGQASSIYSSTKLLLESASDTYLSFSAGFSSYAGILFPVGNDYDNGFIDYNVQSKDMRFAVNGAEAMRIQSDGYIGIGDSSPDYPLDVETVSDIGLQIESKDSASFLVIKDTTQSYGIGTVGGKMYLARKDVGGKNEDLLVVDSDGHVGIGEPEPSATLHAKDSSGRTALRLEGKKVDSDANFADIIGLNSTGATSQISFRRIGANDAAGTIFYTTPSGGSFAERVRIDPSGHVGIGTASPSSHLDVNGNVNVSGTAVVNSLSANNVNISGGDATLSTLTVNTLKVSNGDSGGTKVQFKPNNGELDNYRVKFIEQAGNDFTSGSVFDIETGIKSTNTIYNFEVTIKDNNGKYYKVESSSLNAITQSMPISWEARTWHAGEYYTTVGSKIYRLGLYSYGTVYSGSAEINHAAASTFVNDENNHSIKLEIWPGGYIADLIRTIEVGDGWDFYRDYKASKYASSDFSNATVVVKVEYLENS